MAYKVQQLTAYEKRKAEISRMMDARKLECLERLSDSIPALMNTLIETAMTGDVKSLSKVFEIAREGLKLSTVPIDHSSYENFNRDIFEKLNNGSLSLEEVNELFKAKNSQVSIEDFATYSRKIKELEEIAKTKAYNPSLGEE